MNVLFVCVANSGRSVLAERLFRRAAHGRHRARSAGSAPGTGPHPVVLEAQTYEDANALPLAMQLLDRALAIDPKGLEALAGKAELASAQHDVKTSIATYELILAQMTQDAQKANITDIMFKLKSREMTVDIDAVAPGGEILH